MYSRLDPSAGRIGRRRKWTPNIGIKIRTLQSEISASIRIFCVRIILTPVENFIANIGTVKSVKHQTINTNIFCKMRIEIQNLDPDNEIGITE